MAFGQDVLYEALKKQGGDATTRQPEVVIPKKLQASSNSREFKSDTSAKARKPTSIRVTAGPARRETTSTSAALPMGVKAQKAEQEREEEAGGLLGNWGGIKDNFEKAGVTLDLAYKVDYVSNTGGGIKQDSAIIGNLDVQGTLDLDKIAHIPGLSINLYALGTHGDDATEFVGDSFATSNIEAPSTFKLYEAYLEQSVDERFQISFGLRDLNAIYNAIESTRVFINSAFGITPTFSQTGVNGPSIFPNTALAANAKYESSTPFYFQAGVFNAQAGDPEKPYDTQINVKSGEGFLSVYELGIADEKAANPFKYGAGSWSYTKASDRLDGTGEARNYGFYMVADHKITNTLSLFLKYSTASERVNVFKTGVEAGVNLQGLLPGREDDILGLGYSRAQASDVYVTAEQGREFEAAYELAYQADLGHGIAVTPDFQYIQNPGLSKDVKNAQVVTIRIAIEF